MKNEVDTEHKQRTYGESFLWWLVAAMGVYLLPFVVITVDEILLKTNWFSQHLPGWTGDVLRAIYPFHRIFND